MTCAFFVFVQFQYFVSSHTFYYRVYGKGLLIFILTYWPRYRHDALFCYFHDLELLWLTKLIESAIWMWFLFTCYLISSMCLHYQAFLVWSLNEDDGLLLIYSLIGVHNFCFFFQWRETSPLLFPLFCFCFLWHHVLVALIWMCHEFLTRNKNCLSMRYTCYALCNHSSYYLVIYMVSCR